MGKMHAAVIHHPITLRDTKTETKGNTRAPGKNAKDPQSESKILAKKRMAF